MTETVKIIPPEMANYLNVDDLNVRLEEINIPEIYEDAIGYYINNSD